MRPGLEVEQLLDGAGLRVRTGKQVFGSEFVFPKILFDAKGLDLHGRESGKACPPASSAKLPRAEFLHGKGGNVPRVQLRTAAGYDYEAPSPWQGHVLRSASPWLTALP